MGVRKGTKEAGRWEGYSPNKQASLKSLALPLPPPPPSLHPLSPPQIITTITKWIPCIHALNEPSAVLNTFRVATPLVPQAYEVGPLASPHLTDEATAAHKGETIVLILRVLRLGGGENGGGGGGEAWVLVEKVTVEVSDKKNVPFAPKILSFFEDYSLVCF